MRKLLFILFFLPNFLFGQDWFNIYTQKKLRDSTMERGLTGWPIAAPPKHFYNHNIRGGVGAFLSSDAKTLIGSDPFTKGGKVNVFKYFDGSEKGVREFILMDNNKRKDFGQEMALSRDGNTIAVLSDRPVSYSGDPGSNFIKVYRIDNGGYQKDYQIGQTLYGNGVGDQESFGSSISLSSDGNILAISSPDYRNNIYDEYYEYQGLSSGRIQVYKYNGDKWVQLGKDIIQQLNGLRSVSGGFGKKIFLSADGKHLAVGIPEEYWDDDNEDTNIGGSVVTYRYIRDKWIIYGQRIYGEKLDDEFGNSLSMNKNGTFLVVGAPQSHMSGESHTTKGYVKIYKLKGNSWKQYGKAIKGDENNQHLGYSLSLSDDGKTLAVGLPGKGWEGDDGRVKVFDLDNKKIIQLGTDVKGGNFFGNTVSLNSDGRVLAVGSGNKDLQVFYYGLNGMIKKYVESKVTAWQQKGEFESTLNFQKRVNQSTRQQYINKLQAEAVAQLKLVEKQLYRFGDNDLFKLKKYDADNESFLLYSERTGNIVLSVPNEKAKEFKIKYNAGKIDFENADFIIGDDKLVLSNLDFVDDNYKTYNYTKQSHTTYAQTKIDYNFSEIEVNVPTNTAPTANTKIVKQTNTISVGKSDVDINIPKNATKSSNRFALVIGNEDYSSKQSNLSTEVDVEFARNDANSFKNYLVSTLGFEEDHVTVLTDATGGMINRETAKLVQLAKLDPKSEIVFYYAGHGLPDDDKNPYLLPVDVSTINLKEDGLALKELYSKLASSNAAKITVFLDACFSGGGRDQGLLAARGVKIKPKEEAFSGNMVVFASSSGEERSLPYEEKQHGFFTYFLLKKLQETKGNASYGELSEYIKKEVAKSSLLKKSLQQTPNTNISPSVQGSWESWSFR